VRDRTAEGSGLGALNVDVDPLMVVRGIREGVDPVLVDLEPLAVPEVLADEGLQLGQAVHGVGH
jgi:hypothetical protein